MGKENREVLKDITTSALADGGKLLGWQAAAFIDLTVDVSVMLKMIRTETRTIPHGELDTINVGSPVTEKASENVDTGNTYDPTFGKIPYSVTKVRSAFNLTTESYQDNIEGQGLRNRTMTSFAKRIATDFEMLAIEGDASITDAGVTDRLLKTDDGWDVQTATGCHYVDVGGKSVSLALFNTMIKAMPSRYKLARGSLVFFVGPSTYQDYWNVLAARNTNLGDRAIDSNIALRAYGVPVVEIPLIPEDKTVTSPYSTTGSFVWLTVPSNFIFISLRMMDVYWEFQPRTDRWENTTYSQVDMVIENKDAIVKAINVDIEGAAYS